MVFEDRVAKYPGRWTMVKSDGTSEIVTLIRNDEPTKEGTPINAATLNELSTVAGAINAKEEAVSAASSANSSAPAQPKTHSQRPQTQRVREALPLLPKLKRTGLRLLYAPIRRYLLRALRLTQRLLATR